MTSRSFRSEALLLLAAAVWGFAFVAQRAGMEHLGPFYFNGIRFALGTLVLVPFLVSNRTGRGRSGGRIGGELLLPGITAGGVLFLGASLQQVGIVTTTAGKAGFITGLYVILVPILGLFLRQSPRPGTWAGAVLALAGLSLLTGAGSGPVVGGDLLVLASALFFAIHVLLIGRYSSRPGARVVPLAAVQFGTCSLLSLIVAAFFEETGAPAIRAAALPLLYGGILSVGVAYTLQVAGQRHASPAHAAILLSMETVFALVGGTLLLGEHLPPRGIAGCAIMLAGILVSQVSVTGRRNRERSGP